MKIVSCMILFSFSTIMIAMHQSEAHREGEKVPEESRNMLLKKRIEVGAALQKAEREGKSQEANTLHAQLNETEQLFQYLKEKHPEKLNALTQAKL